MDSREDVTISKCIYYQHDIHHIGPIKNNERPPGRGDR